MRIFKDALDRDWSIEVNVPIRKRVLAETKFDLFSVLEEGQLGKLEDPELLVAVLFSLCGEQATTKGIQPEQYAVGMVGDTLDIASDALMEAIADFFPSRRRLPLRAALARGKEAVTRAMEKALKKINEADIESLLQAKLKNGSTSLPESSESIQLAQDSVSES